MEEHRWTFRGRDGKEHEWVCYKHPGEEGFELLGELADIASHGAPAVAGIGLAKLMTNGLDTDIDSESIARGIMGIFARAHTKGMLDLSRRLLRYSQRDARRFAFSTTDKGDSFFSFNQAFAGNYGELRHALYEICKFNFVSFFDGFGPGVHE